MRFLDDKDIAAVQASFSQVIKDAIGQIANVLVPAVETASETAIRNGLSGVTLTVGPIVIKPIKVTVGLENPREEVAEK